jgi:hypothetical protein
MLMKVGQYNYFIGIQYKNSFIFKFDINIKETKFK